MVQDFIYLKCVRKHDCGEGDGDGGSDGLVVDGGVLKEVQQFCYWEICWTVKQEWREQ